MPWLLIVFGCAIDTTATSPSESKVPARPLLSDHADAPFINEYGIVRREADLTDLYAFQNGSNLVLILCSNPSLTRGTTHYLFPPDLSLRIHIDNQTPVTFDDPNDLRTFGGTIDQYGEHISDDITFEITFHETGTAPLHLNGLKKEALDQITWTAGVFDDPFINVSQNTQLRNTAAIVLELPLALVTGSSGTILVWGTSWITEFPGPILDHVGRASWSAVTPININQLKPKHHYRETGFQSNVIIFDTFRPAGFPNGRRLEDDVRHIIRGDPPSTNCSSFPAPSGFPYLAPPNVFGLGCGG